MPRIYKPIGSTENKAVEPAVEIKASDKKLKPPKPEDDKKNDEQ